MKSKDDLIVALSVGKENGDFIRWEKPGNKTSKWWKYRRLPALMFILQTIDDSKGKNSVLFRMLPNLKRKKLMGSGSFGSVYIAEWNGGPLAVKVLHERYFREPHSHNKHFSQASRMQNFFKTSSTKTWLRYWNLPFHILHHQCWKLNSWIVT